MRGVRSAFPVTVGVLALGLAALCACVLLAVPYWSDSACDSAYPGGNLPEAPVGRNAFPWCHRS